MACEVEANKQLFSYIKAQWSWPQEATKPDQSRPSALHPAHPLFPTLPTQYLLPPTLMAASLRPQTKIRPAQEAGQHRALLDAKCRGVPFGVDARTCQILQIPVLGDAAQAWCLNVPKVDGEMVDVLTDG